MKAILFVISFFVFNSLICEGQLGSYDLAAVPENVKKNASVIKLNEEIYFSVESIDEAVLRIKKTFSVMNEAGKGALVFNVGSSKFRKLEDAEIKVYDAAGKQTGKYKKKDMITQAVGDGLIDDGYVTYYAISTNTYPITVEFDYVQRFKGTLFYPRYQILTPGEGVVQSVFTAKVPANFGLRYKPLNTDLQPAIKEEAKAITYKWEVKNLSPIEYEEGAVSYEYRYPSIMLAPNKFKMDDYEGDMTSWKTFGYWYGSLKKGIDVLPDDKKKFFQNMVNQTNDDYEKMKVIYDYLQKNFRYVSIQLGIGGYKPFPANFTDSKKYGDCKGLSNFMQAALDAVGIKSYQALINRESNGMPVDPEFPNNEFNHVILLAITGKDSVWMECTSNTLEFGSLDITTENKNALLITENGGVLVPTPASHSRSNRLYSKTIVQMEDDGYGETETIYRSSGEFREQMEFILGEKRDDQKESVVYTLAFKQPDDFLFERVESKDMHTVKLKMGIEKVPEFSAGSKFFLAPRLHKIWRYKLPKSENRTLDFFFRYPFEITDTTIYKLPAGFKADVIPPAKELSCAYGTFSSKSWYDEEQNAIISAASLELLQHRIPASKFAEVKKFFDDIILSDAQRVVIKKE